jgi:glycosyltransferase involved in cell wall biosynthesis
MSNDQHPASSERPPIAGASLSVVLTACNVASDVQEVLEAWLNYLQGLNRPFEVLLVDDGSVDDTATRAEVLARERPALRVLRLDERRGQGAALETGIRAAQYLLLCYAPCDKQFQPGDLQRLLAVIDQVDIVIGYRVGGPLPAWLAAWDGLGRWLTRIFLGDFPARRECWLGWAGWRRRWLARWVFGLRVQDPECPFRLFRRHLFRRIPIQCRGSFAHIEILAKANHLGSLMGETPVSWVPPQRMPPEPSDLSTRQEFCELFRHPDFGPPQIEGPWLPEPVVEQ